MIQGICSDCKSRIKMLSNLYLFYSNRKQVGEYSCQTQEKHVYDLYFRFQKKYPFHKFTVFKLVFKKF